MKYSGYLAGLALLASCSSPTAEITAKAPTETARLAPTTQLSPDSLLTTAAQEFGPLRVPVKTVGILLYDGYTPLDAMGPYQVLSEIPGVEIKLIAKQKGVSKNNLGPGIEATDALADVRALDILVIPGGLGGTYQVAHDTTIVNWVRRIDKTTKYTTSVCTGAWVLGAASFLKDKPATTHWYGKRVLEAEYGAHYQPRRYVQTGKYWTSAGITAGMDMALALLNDIAGEKYTRAAMLDLEYAPEPPFTGGTEATTTPRTTAWLRAMYDRSLDATNGHARPATATGTAADPVCGMAVGSGSHLTAAHQGKTYAFCSGTCRATFLKNPTAYLGR